MNKQVLKWIKAIAGAFLIFILLMVVNRYWTDYRTMATSAETTTTATAPPEGEAKDAKDESAKKKSSTSTKKTSDAKDADTQTVVVLTDGLNFRESPDQDSNVIRGLDEGETLVLVKKSSGWYQVEDDEGTKGWVSGSSEYTKVQ